MARSSKIAKSRDRIRLVQRLTQFAATADDDQIVFRSELKGFGHPDLPLAINP